MIIVITSGDKALMGDNPGTRTARQEVSEQSSINISKDAENDWKTYKRPGVQYARTSF